MALQTSENDASSTGAELAEFRNLSRQMLYMALFDNEALGLAILTGDTSESAGLLARFSRYLYDQMADQFLSPDELTIDQWTDMAGQVAQQNEQTDVDYSALADQLYRLLKRELRLEQERVARRR
jgi:hypothetical protein